MSGANGASIQPSPQAGKSPDLDVPPPTQKPLAEAPNGDDYFSPRHGSSPVEDDEVTAVDSLDGRTSKRRGSSGSNSSGASTVVSPQATSPDARRPSVASVASPGIESNGSGRESRMSSSAASVTFRPPSKSLPQGHQRSERYRSPSPDR
jgi:hypothetical protein